MVKDNTNKIYTELMEYVKDIYPKIYSGQTYDENKPKLPYIYFYQIDAPTALDDLSNNEVGVKFAYQIEVYTDNGINKAKEIATVVRTYMISIGFKCRNFMPIQTLTNVKRFVGRYEKLEV